MKTQHEFSPFSESGFSSHHIFSGPRKGAARLVRGLALWLAAGAGFLFLGCPIVPAVLPSVGWASIAPAATNANPTAISADATGLAFTLPQEYNGEWKVYTTPTGGSALTTISAFVTIVANEPTLVLQSSSPIRPRTYYVSFAEEGRGESEGRLALWGPPLTDDTPMSLAKRFRLDNAEAFLVPDPQIPFSPLDSAYGVSAVFNLLHAYIGAVGASGPDNTIPAIALGDWIDLHSLTVEAFNPAGGDEGGYISLTNSMLNGDPNRYSLRLLVVGNNSFHYPRGDYDPPASAGEYNSATPHLVFQFQNSPGTRSMDKRDYLHSGNVSKGYYYTTMRGYLTPLTKTAEDDSDLLPTGSGKYLEGLIAAGIPADVFFAPIRYVIKGDSPGDRTKVKAIADKVWLPTIWELLWIDPSRSGGFYSNLETAANQARLEYYTDAAKRIKEHVGGNNYYWTASPASGGTSNFCAFGDDGSSVIGVEPDMQLQVCPAFCVW